jgi:UDP-N-acetylglucosamine 2-epimerase
VEVPSFGIPTVNIGNRQKGRIHPESVINTVPDAQPIKMALEKALSDSFSQFAKTITNPYEKRDSAKRIFEVLKGIDLKGICVKEFYKIN